MRTAPIFKGATRPACVMGIPIKPFVAVCSVGLLLGFWVWMPLILLLPVALRIMSQITAKDDQAFRQLWISWQTRHIGQVNKHLWGSVASIAPTDYKRKES